MLLKDTLNTHDRIQLATQRQRTKDPNHTTYELRTKEKQEQNQDRTTEALTDARLKGANKLNTIMGTKHTHHTMVTQSVKTKSELQAYMGKTITACEGQVTIHIGKGEGITLQAGSSIMIGWRNKKGTKKGTEGIEIKIKNDTKTATTMTSYGSATKTR